MCFLRKIEGAVIALGFLFFTLAKPESGEVVYIAGEEIRTFDGSKVKPWISEKANGQPSLLSNLLKPPSKRSGDEEGFDYLLLDAGKFTDTTQQKNAVGQILSPVTQASKMLPEEGYPSPANRLWLVSQDGTARLVSESSVGKAVLSPDASKIAFVAVENGIGSVRIESIKGKLLATIPSATCPIWSPSGESIALSRIPPRYMSLKKPDICTYVQLTLLNAKGFNEEFTLRDSYGHCPLAYHPSGGWILYYECPTADGQSLWTLSLDNQEVSLNVLKDFYTKPNNQPGQRAWSADGKWFVYSVGSYNPGNPGEVWGMEFDDEKRIVRVVQLDTGRLIHLPLSSGIIAIIQRDPTSIPKPLLFPE